MNPLIFALVTATAAQQAWMTEHFETIKTRTLMHLTLPGSHNSGNTAGELNDFNLCLSDYRYANYAALGPNPMSITDFDAIFEPWNVNHDMEILGQLNAGARFFHLKVCNFNRPEALSVDLGKVYHQHRGYTAKSLNKILETMALFLLENPKEILALGLNNLHQNVSATVTDREISTLSLAVRSAFNAKGVRLIDEQHLRTKSINHLVVNNIRVAVFFKGDASLHANGIIASDSALAENWNDDMASGNLTAAVAWLKKDLVEEASKREKFYVMQANPNDDDQHMLERIRAQGNPRSLKTWEWNFLRGLSLLVEDALEQEPAIQINVVSTDFFEISRPYDVAMRLNGLPTGRDSEVDTLESNAICVNPAVVKGKFADEVVDDNRYRLHGAYVMQRHMDRWLYEHDLIKNICWPGQRNSSRKSSQLAASECDFGTRVLETAWATFPESFDPYAAPGNGTCQVYVGTPQGTKQGVLHAEMWGEMLHQRYMETGLLSRDCPAGTIALHSDNVHKNELALQTEYRVLCGREPDANAEFLASAVLATGKVAPGMPWYLDTGMCGGDRLSELTQEADDARLSSSWWQNDVQAITEDIAGITGHPVPKSEHMAELLDSIIDCTVIHACTGLGGIPQELVDSSGLPNMDASSLFHRMNAAETLARVFPLEHFRNTNMSKFMEYASLYYGYYFGVLRDQLFAVVNGDNRAPRLTISVMSDSNISPQLAFYNLDAARLRPPYLSSLIHELLLDTQTGEYLIRIVYNGEVQTVCPSQAQLCPLHEWLSLVQRYVPSRKACPILYDNYKFLAPQGSMLPIFV